MDYSYEDIKAAYKAVGVEHGCVVSLKTDLRWLGGYDHPEPRQVLPAHYNALSELIDLNEGTIVVPTGSMSLCNTEKAFDLEKTPSEMGVLTEYIRKQEGSVRSFHPFVSHTAVGKYAKEMCGEVSRNAFGLETPSMRLVEMDALEVSIGLHPRFTCSLVHQMEMLMGVPYRYVKEFIHPVVRNGEVKAEPFYMHVWYRDCDIKRNDNAKIFEYFKESAQKIVEVELGRGKVYAYSLKGFFDSTVDLLKKDLFAWLEREPEVKPYRV